MSIIENIKSFEILDSRGIPTVLSQVILENGKTGMASVPSGASTGVHEALELRDKDTKRYNGKGVLNNLKYIHSEILDVLQGFDVRDQKKIDATMIELDGTKNKKRLGANTILSVSLACAKAAANSCDLHLYNYLGGVVSNLLPVPLVNIINGGAHASNNLDIQEYMITPIGAKSFSEAIRWCSEIFHLLKEILKKNNYTTAIGDEGGFASEFNNNEEPIEFILKAIKANKLEPGKDVFISLDIASTEFYKNKKYVLSSINKKLSSYEMIDYLENLRNKYPIYSIEDGCSEDDWIGWNKLTEKLSDKTVLIGDDLFVTNKKRLERGIKEKSANGILIKPNQIGTLTETLQTMRLARNNNIKTVISHRSGETEDNFIADLSVGTNSKFIKTGSVTRSERCSKYNRILNIEKDNNNLYYSGLDIDV